MPMRHDIEKFRQAVDAKYDDPKIPGKDDVPGDQDLKAGVLGTLAVHIVPVFSLIRRRSVKVPPTSTPSR